MIPLAWHTIRARRAGFVGTFVALALGVGLLATMALTLASTVGGDHTPRWYTTADVVVRGIDSISVTVGTGEDRETETLGTARSQPLPADLPARLSTVDATVVVDHAGYAATAGAPGDTVHPWSAAGLHAYTWVAGGPPAGPADIVLSAPTSHRPGDRVTVLTVRGAEEFTVSGVLRTDALPALYAQDAVAADRAGGRIEAIALTARPGTTTASLRDRVRAIVGDGALVLTGDRRQRAEPRPDAEQLAVAVSLLSVTCGLAGFVSIFVVSGTFAYAVAARRREFGLLRAAGATPRQVRRLVLGEALVVGGLASLTGAAIGSVLAPLFAHWLARTGFAPESFTARFIAWPVLAAIGVGLLVTLLGSWLAARRAGRVRPVEALREAAVDRRPMTVTRWIVGLLALGGVAPMMLAMSEVDSAEAVAIVLNAAMLLIVGCAMFAPVVIPPLVWLLTVPLAAARGAIGMLARNGARTAVRRTASTAAPILVTVGISGATLASLGTLVAAERSAARDRIAVEAMAVPAAGAGLADPTVAALRAAPGVAAAVPVTEAPVYLRLDGSPVEWTARYVAGPDLAGVLNVPLAAGSLADLTGTDTIAVPAGRWRVGDRIALWLGDATPVRLRVVATFAEQMDLAETMFLPWALRDGHANPLADIVYLRFAPGAGLAVAGTRDGLGAVAEAGGGVVVRTGDFLSARDVEQDRINRLALIAVLGMALAYTGISIANTLVMATNDRARDLATLRLAGATPRQVLRMIFVESILVTGIGVFLAAVVTAATVAATRWSLAGLAPSVPVVVPWGAIGAISLVCLVTAVVASVVPAALLLRRHPAN